MDWTRSSVIRFTYCLYLVIILTSLDNFWPQWHVNNWIFVARGMYMLALGK